MRKSFSLVVTTLSIITFYVISFCIVIDLFYQRPGSFFRSKTVFHSFKTLELNIVQNVFKG